MDEKEREEFLTYLDEFERKVTENKDTARKFLIEAGIYTPKGRLTEHYKHLYISPLDKA